MALTHLMEIVLLQRYFIFLLTLILTGCISVQNESFQEAKAHISKRQFLVWMLSDIQPETTIDRNIFESAIEDINENIGLVDIGIMAGDLLKSRSKDDDYNWLIETRNKAKVTNWYQIAGNHDARSGEIFYKYFPGSKNYALKYGNLLFLFLSDQSSKSRTDISDETFLWWKDMVENNREKIIITVSHAQLKNSGLIGSFVPSRTIHNSERFEKVLQQEKVALWVSGHSHLPHVISGPGSANEDLGGTFFVNVGTINDKYILDSESRFNSAHEMKIPLGRSFSLGNGKPKVF